MGEMVVAPFLLRSKIMKVDTLVLTHPEADHMSGLRYIADHFSPREFWYNGEKLEFASFRELMALLEAKGIRRKTPADLWEGRDISGAHVEILHPAEGVLSKKSNDNSLVMRISSGGTSFLFPGDLEAAGEHTLVSRSGSRLKSDVLLAPHHGSKSSSSTPFLEAVTPNACIVSCGRENPFGFPSFEVLGRLKSQGCRVLRVDEVGAIEVSAAQGGFQIKSFR
jgi:competence protein ComEC